MSSKFACSGVCSTKSSETLGSKAGSARQPVVQRWQSTFLSEAFFVCITMPDVEVGRLPACRLAGSMVDGLTASKLLHVLLLV